MSLWLHLFTNNGTVTNLSVVYVGDKKNYFSIHLVEY